MRQPRHHARARRRPGQLGTRPADRLIFDLDEIRRLRVFARQFHLSVFFACLDPGGGDLGFWVRLDQLDFARVIMRGGKQAVACPHEKAMQFSMSYNFYDAFFDALTRI